MTSPQFDMIGPLGRPLYIYVSGHETLASAPRFEGASTVHFLISGELEATLHGRPLHLEAPALLCLGRLDTPRVSRDTSRMRTVIFHPGELHDDFFDHPADGPGPFSGTAHNNRYYLEPFIAQPGRQALAISLDCEAVDRLTTLLDRLDIEISTKPDGYWPCRSRSFLLELLFLLRRWTDSPPERRDMDAVIAWIHGNCKAEFTLDDLARRFATNRTSLARRFKEATGKTIGTYARDIRVNLAGNLLRNTTLPLQEILDRAGFADNSHFNRVFKATTGLTPARYRKESNWILPKFGL